MTYFWIFLQSNLLEVPFYFYFFRTCGWSLARTALFVTMMNAVTHPAVFFGIMNLPLTYFENIVIAESFAVLVEAACLVIVLRPRDGKTALGCLVTSFVANLVSWQLAPVLTYLVGRG